MNITILIQLIMIIIVIAIIKTKNNLHLIILFSAFSLMAASLYFMYSAPDVALSEISIGCGIIPLIFIIAISKQNEFIVINHSEDNFLDNNDENDVGKGYEILNNFCNHYDLKLKIYNTTENQLRGVFRAKNIDLIVYSCSSTNNYILKGKSSNILMNKLEQITKNINHITIIRVGENETID
jgi:putative multicomponent Na+:H+ antiporter subunit B